MHGVQIHTRACIHGCIEIHLHMQTRTHMPLTWHAHTRTYGGTRRHTHADTPHALVHTHADTHYMHTRVRTHRYICTYT